MFNVLVNNNLFDKKNFRLLTLNNDYNNKMLLFILLSNYNQNNSSINLTEFSSNDLNKITNTLKKDLNKHVKNKYNINYLNLNNKNHLNILSNLFEINLKIFNKNFNETKFMSDTNHNKSMYFLERNNKLHLVSTKNKNNIQYSFNNILYGGGYEASELEKDTKIIQEIVVTISGYNQETDLTIGLFEHFTPNDSFYSLEQVNKFLMNQQTQIQETGNYNDYLKEIFTATFTNIFRNDIYIIIDKINKELANFVKYLQEQSFLNINGCKLIICGGDCFNSFLSDNENKPISPDIDVKLVIESDVAKNLHNKNYTNDNQKKEYTLLFNLSLLIIRNKLYEILDEIVNDMNSKLEYYNDIFVKSYQGLLKYMEQKGYINNELMSVDNIFITKYGKRIKSFKKRFNHMESGYKKKNKLDLPFTINNVLLYSIDGLFENEKTTWTGLAGILDIVISLPTHTGYMLDTEYESFQYESFENSKKDEHLKYNFTNLYRMTKDYYINKDNLKMVEYGLRTANKKILKDFTRILILIKYDNTENNISNKGNIIQKIINKLNELKEVKDYESHINDIDNMLEFIRTCLNFNLTGGTKRKRNNNNNQNSIRSKDFESFCSLNNIFKSIDYNFDVNDENIYDEEIENNSNNSNNSTQMGGFIKKSNYLEQIEVSYKLPKALYYMISEKILSDYPDKDKNKILNQIINVNEQTNSLGLNIKNINYEKLTELTEGIADNRSKQLTNPLVLNELFNSDALYRFKNTSYNKWSQQVNGILKIKPEIVKLLNHITGLLDNQNNIQKLYYFDIININTTNVANYNNTVNREVAKCLMHTFMHSLSPEFMQIDDIYRRFFKNTGKKRTANNNNVINSKIEDIKQINELQSILNFYNKIKEISELEIS